MARELSILGADFASINIGNSHGTQNEARRESQIPDKTEGSLLLPLKLGNSSNCQGTIPGATASPNLCLPILDRVQYITLSDSGQTFYKYEMLLSVST